MCNGRRFVIIAMCVAFAVSLCLPAFNVVLDSYGVFGTLLGTNLEYRAKKQWEPTTNDRFKIMHYLMHGTHSYDSFLMGSSRAGALRANKMGPNWYLLSYAGGRPAEYLHDLRVYVKKNKIDRVIVALDNVSFYRIPKNTSPQNRLYPDSITSWCNLMKFYLYKWPTKKQLEMTCDREKYQRRRVTYEYLGLRNVPKEPAGSDAQNRKLKALPPYTATMLLLEEKPRYKKVFAALEDTVSLAQSAGFELLFLINPFHYKNLIAMDFDAMLSYKKRLADLIPFWDFSGLHKYSLDNKYWKETSHFDVYVGDMMLDAVEGKQSEGFGRKISASNVEQHHSEMVRKIRMMLPDLLLEDKNIWVHESLLSQAVFYRSDFRDPDQIVSTHQMGKVLFGEHLRFSSTGKDAHFILAPFSFPADRTAVIKIQLSVPNATKLKLFYKERGQKNYRKDLCYSKDLKKGMNYLFVPLEGRYLEESLRVQPGEVMGLCRIDTIEVRAIPGV